MHVRGAADDEHAAVISTAALAASQPNDRALMPVIVDRVRLHRIPGGAAVKRRIVAIVVALACATTGCSALKGNAPDVARGIGDAVVDAAHDHVLVHLPEVSNPVDLGDLKLDALQAKLRDVFGTNETKEDVGVVCRAKDAFAKQTGTRTADAVRSALAAMNITRSDEEIAELARLTQNALVTSADPHALGRAAVAWACQWAAG
ncbi:MAG: hypothetical protein QOH89_2921 [Pseudonocardiales bacterium]|nr:hypothetical protein [Pseudonocardiales bacterium]